MPDSSQPALVALGVIAKPHGLQGEVRVHLFNADSQLLSQLDEVLLRDETGEVFAVRVLGRRQVPKALLLRLEDCADRERANSLRGLELCVPREALPPLAEGEYYLADLIGLRVMQAGTLLGEVRDVVEYPSAACLQVPVADGFYEIPLEGPWISEVDVDAGEVRVNTLDDLPLQRG